MNQYMVQFTIEENPDPAFFYLIPAQREVINKMMEKGKILSYTLDATRTHLWCIVNAVDDDAVEEMIAEFPLTRYMVPQIFPLMFHNSIMISIPKFSLN